MRDFSRHRAGMIEEQKTMNCQIKWVVVEQVRLEVCKCTNFHYQAGFLANLTD